MARGYIGSGGGNPNGSSDCTATKAELLKGYTAILKDSDDEVVEGTLELTGNAGTANVLENYSFYNNNPKSKLNGTMPNLTNRTTVDFASNNATPVIVCDAWFEDTNTDGVRRTCFRYNGNPGYIVPNTLFGFPMTVNSLLSFL